MQILEKDIEQWMFDNPDKCKLGPVQIGKWIGRQITLPSGRLDLLGTWKDYEDERVVVVELKNTELDESALAQVVRYAHDVKNILGNFGVVKVLVGPSQYTIRTDFFHAAVAMNVFVVRFDTKFSVGFDRVDWMMGYRQKIFDELTELASKPPFCDLVRGDDDEQD